VDCINRLKAMFDTISALERNNDNITRINQEAQRMIRVLTILRVYIADCDEAYSDERAILPLFRHVAIVNHRASVLRVCNVALDIKVEVGQSRVQVAHFINIELSCFVILEVLVPCKL